MAIAKEIWDKAKFLFELGKPLSEIALETGISKGQISKRANSEDWSKGKKKQLKAEIMEVERENETILQKKETVVSKLKNANLNDFEITMFDETVRKELKHEGLIFNTATLALIRNNEILTRGTKQVMLKVAQYADGQKIGEEYEPYQVPLTSKDVQECIDGTDKASITLGVNARHAPKQDITQNQIQQQSTEDKSWTVNIIKPDNEQH